MKTPRMSDERGIALAVAVLALVVIGALVAGSFYAGRVEQRGGQNALYAAQAFEAAEAGLTTTIDNWPAALNTRAVAVDSVFPVASFGGGNEVTVTVTRLSATTSMIRSEGVHRDAGGGLMSRGVVSTLAKYVTPRCPSGRRSEPGQPDRERHRGHLRRQLQPAGVGHDQRVADRLPGGRDDRAGGRGQRRSRPMVIRTSYRPPCSTRPR